MPKLTDLAVLTIRDLTVTFTPFTDDGTDWCEIKIGPFWTDTSLSIIVTNEQATATLQRLIFGEQVADPTLCAVVADAIESEAYAQQLDPTPFRL